MRDKVTEALSFRYIESSFHVESKKWRYFNVETAIHIYPCRLWIFCCRSLKGIFRHSTKRIRREYKNVVMAIANEAGRRKKCGKLSNLIKKNSSDLYKMANVLFLRYKIGDLKNLIENCPIFIRHPWSSSKAAHVWAISQETSQKNAV